MLREALVLEMLMSYRCDLAFLNCTSRALKPHLFCFTCHPSELQREREREHPLYTCPEQCCNNAPMNLGASLCEFPHIIACCITS